MARFIKIADDAGSCDFLDLDHVTKVSCSVMRAKTGGGFDIRSVTDPTVKSQPVSETVTAVISLATAGGIGEVRFTDLGEATQWAKDQLGIEVPFIQL
jgi:hypothetical protein